MQQKVLQTVSKRLLWTLMAVAVLHMFGCATLSQSAPQKPSIELGVIDFAAGEVVVNMTANPSFKSIQHSTSAPSYREVFAAVVTNGNRVPLASYDKAVAFKPAQWTLVQNYMNALVRFIQNHCSGN